MAIAITKHVSLTSIALHEGTREQLDERRLTDGESFDSVIRRLLDEHDEQIVINKGVLEELMADE